MALVRFYSGGTASGAEVGGDTGNDEAVRTKLLAVPNAAKRQRWSANAIVFPFAFGAAHASTQVRIGGGIGDVHIRSVTFPVLELDADALLSLTWRAARAPLSSQAFKLQMLAGTPAVPGEQALGVVAETVSPFRVALRQQWAGSVLTPGVWDLTMALDATTTVARGMAVVRYCVRHTD